MYVNNPMAEVKLTALNGIKARRCINRRGLYSITDFLDVLRIPWKNIDSLIVVNGVSFKTLHSCQEVLKHLIEIMTTTDVSHISNNEQVLDFFQTNLRKVTDRETTHSQILDLIRQLAVRIDKLEDTVKSQNILIHALTQREN